MRSVILFFLVLAFSIRVYGQSTQQHKVDSVFQLVKQYYNARQPDSIYALAGEKFHAALTPETFRYVCTSQLFPIGAIKNASLMSFVNNQMGTYRLEFETTNLQLQITLDDKNKVELFLFQPFKKQVSDKLYTVASSNLLRTESDKKVDSAVQSYIKKSNTVGLSIGVIQHGKISTYHYGETKLGNHHLPDANTLFEIGSISKTFTATLLAYFVNEGKIKLSDPLIKFLPDTVASNKALTDITIEMLSNHTSGLPRLPDNLVNHSLDPLDPYRDYKKKDLFDYLKTAKLESKPGEKYAYSNLAVGLLGTILEQISGKTYEQMVEEIICKPLKMNNTAQHLSAAQQAKFVTVYNEEGKETPAWNFATLAPCGALRSTVNDLLNYAAAQMSTNSVDKLSGAIALTHKVTFSDKDLQLGLGWHIIKIGGAAYYFHNGGTYGCSSFLVFDPQKNFAVVLLSNSGESVDATGAEIVKKLQ